MIITIRKDALSQYVCDLLFEICFEALEKNGQVKIGENDRYVTNDIRITSSVRLIGNGPGIITREVPGNLKKKFKESVYPEFLQVCPELAGHLKWRATVHFAKGCFQHIDLEAK